VAHVKQGSKQLSKLEDHNIPMVFIGSEPGYKAWRFYNPTTKWVNVSCDAVLEEDTIWSQCDEVIGDGDPFMMEFIHVGGTAQVGNPVQPGAPLAVSVPIVHKGQVHTPRAPPQAKRSGVCHATIWEPRC
jgi:hypothetical protein